MSQEVYQKLLEVITSSAQPLSTHDDRYAGLLENIGDARFILIGEATHGTQEFYQARMDITRQLIEQNGFMAIAIEGDWPDAYRIHRYVHGAGDKSDWNHALADFKRFPVWMWRNTTMPPFLTWLREYNDHLPSPAAKIGFYGLDLYSMNASMQAVIDYLATVDAEAAARARSRYSCFDHLKADPQTYGYLTTLGVKPDCIKQAVEQLMELQHHAFEYLQHDGIVAEDEYFFATQNARLVKNAEKYYRSMFEGHIQSWNVRDQHMTETLNILADHLENRFEKPAKIVVWAHNSHLGDARATEMGTRGECNIGQLMREQHDNDVYSIGFSTNSGTVTAADDWGDPCQSKLVNAGIEGSYEELFHQIKHKNFLLNFRGNKELEHYLQIPRLQRAIGVIYRPETERESHYFFTKLPYQFDSMIHFDHTNALPPLDQERS